MKIKLDENLWLCTHYYISGWISKDGKCALSSGSENFKRGVILAKNRGLATLEEEGYMFLKLTPLGIAFMRLLQ